MHTPATLPHLPTQSHPAPRLVVPKHVRPEPIPLHTASLLRTLPARETNSAFMLRLLKID